MNEILPVNLNLSFTEPSSIPIRSSISKFFDDVFLIIFVLIFLFAEKKTIVDVITTPELLILLCTTAY